MAERRPPDGSGPAADPGGDPPGGAPSSGAGAETVRALEEAEDRYRQLVENSEDLIFTHDLDGRILSANPTMVRETGRPLSELVGLSFEELLIADDRRDFPAYLETLARDGHAHGFVRIRTADGTERLLQYDNVVERERGSPVVRGIAHDVQRRFAEHALPLSLRRLEALLNNIPDLAWMKDERSRYIAVNEAFARFVGRTRREIVGRTDFDLFDTELARRFQEEDAAAMRTGETVHRTDRFPALGGQILLFDTITAPIRDGSGDATGTAGIARDMTEHRRLEERLLHSQKMEAIGRLAGGVAHDFNNLLTTILGFSGLVLDQLAPDDRLRPEIEEIHRAGERAAALTRQLLAFSRKQIVEPTVLDLNAVVSDAIKMLRRLIGEDVELEVRLQERLGAVRADRGQIEQVLVNLAVNARDAMEQGGRLAIETRDAPGYVPYRSEGEGLPAAPYVLLAVSDSGAGMDSETRRRIFEPFFTTKGPGKGTGLGLATVYGIVKQSGGDIWVESEPGRGTKFSVYLPRVDAPAPEPPPARPASFTGGTETVLLVEDEEAVRRLASRVLRAAGYEVLAAGDAAEARRIWSEQGARVRLLITDVVMPGGSGPQLAQELAGESPGLLVLYMSGYTDSAIVDRSAVLPGTSYLQKPFTPEALVEKVRRVLDGLEGPGHPADPPGDRG